MKQTTETTFSGAYSQRASKAAQTAADATPVEASVDAAAAQQKEMEAAQKEAAFDVIPASELVKHTELIPDADETYSAISDLGGASEKPISGETDTTPLDKTTVGGSSGATSDLGGTSEKPISGETDTTPLGGTTVGADSGNKSDSKSDSNSSNKGTVNPVTPTPPTPSSVPVTFASNDTSLGTVVVYVDQWVEVPERPDQPVYATGPLSGSTSSAGPLSSGNDSDGVSYPIGTVLRVSALPKAGAEFKRWNDGSTATQRSITVSQAASYVAIFEKKASTPSTTTYQTLTVNWDKEMGRVTANGANVSEGSLELTVRQGDSVTLTATPKPKHAFKRWTGLSIQGNAQSNTTPTITLTVSRDLTLRAEFEAESNGGGNNGGGNDDGIIDPGIKIPKTDEDPNGGNGGNGNNGGNGSNGSNENNKNNGNGSQSQGLAGTLRRYWWVLAVALGLYLLGKEDRK